jgi:hypothetical protein
MSSITQPNISFAKTEQFDPTKARYVLSQPIDEEDRKKIKKMLKSKTGGGFLNINYVLGSKTKQNAFAKQFIGRLFPQGNYGFQSLSGDVRRFLAQDYYFDLDIVNAQCEILNQIAKKRDWSNTNLNKLCVERTEVFAEIMKDTGKDRKEVKTMFISLLFGGNTKPEYGQWINQCFHPEVVSIMTQLSVAHPQLLTHSAKKNPSNPYGTCCALILQTEERKCLLALDTFLTTHGRSMDTFIHDGGLVQKLKNETHFPEDLKRQAESFIEKETGYRLKLETKTMESTFKLPNQVPEDKSYVAVKTEFEKHVFKCINDSSFHEIRPPRHTVYSRRDFITSYEHMKYSVMSNGLISEEQFITSWLEDEQARKYRYVETIFPPCEEPEDVYNLFTGLPVEHFEDSTEDDESDIEFLKNHIALLCGHDVLLTQYVLNWLGHLFQFPGSKNGIAILFQSNQGMGKNLTYEILQKMMGIYAIMVDKPETDLFGNFNGLVEGKLLTLIDVFKDGFKYSDKLKSLITGTTMDITRKGRESRCVPNLLRFMFFTNHRLSVPVDGDRRYVVASSFNQEVPTKAYFERLAGFRENKRVLKGFYNYLMGLDLSSIDWIRDRPMTDAYNDMRVNSLAIEIKFLLSFSSGREEVIDKTGKELFGMFQHYLQEIGSDVKTNPIKFGINLKKILISFFIHICMSA